MLDSLFAVAQGKGVSSRERQFPSPHSVSHVRSFAELRGRDNPGPQLPSASTLIASASADPCPDIEVTFARGTDEPPGVGAVGQEFIDSLRSQVRGRSLGVYPVNYPAGDDIAPSASVGANDAHAHVRSMVASCPNTKLVLGGYSQGAGVIDLTTISRAPILGLMPDILTADEAAHVAALALFGNPSDTGNSKVASRATGLSEWCMGQRPSTCVRPAIRCALRVRP